MLYPMLAKTFGYDLLCIVWNCFVVTEDAAKGYLILVFIPQTWCIWA